MDYADYRHLIFDRRPNGVVLVTINRPEAMNATNARLHWELTQVWLTLDADPGARVALITGAGKAFSAGGDLGLVEEMAGNAEAAARTMREASDLVYNLINLDKPVVSAINGTAVGAGLVVALLADISIMAETAKITDGHTRLGGRSCRHHLAAPLRHGQGQVLSSDQRVPRRPGGRAHRARQPLRPVRHAHGDRVVGRRRAGRRQPARDPLHQARAQ